MKKLLVAAVLFFNAAAFFAQTKTERDLESAVRIYNAMRDFTGALKPATVTDADVASVSKSATDGLALLDPILKTESGQIAVVARYFRANFLYEEAFVLGMKGRRAESFELLRGIDADMNGFTSSRFPLEYAFEGRNYVVKWENFAPTQGEYNVSMAELFNEKKDYDNALAYANKANENGAFLSDYLKTLNNYWIIGIKTERREYDRVALDAALTALESYQNLEPADRATMSGELSKVLESAPALLDQTLAANPMLVGNGEPYARTARVLRAEDRAEQYRAFAAKALRAGYRERSFLTEALSVATSANDRALGNLAADQLAALTADDDCPGLADLAGAYTRLGEQAKADFWNKKASQCDRGRQRDEAEARRDFGLYVGGYLFPLFRRDWGVVAGIMTRKVYIEASYQRENENRDRLWDLRLRGVDGARDEKIYWDGYYAHLAINSNGKNTGRRGLRPYSGVLLGYNVREYEQIESGVFDRNANVDLGKAIFNPVETRYILMLNAGVHSYGKLLAADFFLSAGASYDDFDRGNPDYRDNKTLLYDSVFLENRRASRFSFMARIGITIGFQVGTNNRRA